MQITFENLPSVVGKIAEDMASLHQLLATKEFVAPPPPEIVNTDELCNRLDITPPTAIRWRKNGVIPSMEIGSAVRFNWPDVVKALSTFKGGKAGRK